MASMTRLLPLLSIASFVSLAGLATGCGSPAPDSTSSGSASAVSAADDNVDPTNDDGGAPSAPANFAQVRDGLYRGAHPDQDNLAYLQSIGVKTIVDLEIADYVEATPGEISEEVANATAMGFKVIREPLSAFTLKVNDAEITSTLAILADSTNGPIYVHCRHGQDRTGMVIGLERVLQENWSQDDAYSEMLDFGFHTYFVGLKDYFFDKTNGH